MYEAPSHAPGRLAAALRDALVRAGLSPAVVVAGPAFFSSEHGLDGAVVSDYAAAAQDVRADLARGVSIHDWDDHLADPRVDWWP